MQRGPGQPWDGATGTIVVQTHHTPGSARGAPLLGGWDAHRATGGAMLGSTRAPASIHLNAFPCPHLCSNLGAA